MNLLLVGKEWSEESVNWMQKLSIVFPEQEWFIEQIDFPENPEKFLSLNSVDWIISEVGDVEEGIYFLNQSKKYCPSSKRILVLNNENSEVSLKATQVAHHIVFNKKDENGWIESFIEWKELNDLIEQDYLKVFSGQVHQLPKSPETYLKLSNAITNNKASTFEIASIIEKDMVLAAKVLNLCNSAFFINRKPVADIKQAVITLGNKQLSRLVLASEVFFEENFFDKEEIKKIKDKAVIASKIASRLVSNSSSEYAAIAALLARIGLLIPVSSNFSEDEKIKTGAWLLGFWGLPLPIVEAVAFHNNPKEKHFQSFWLVAAVHLSYLILDEKEISENLKKILTNKFGVNWFEIITKDFL